MTIPVAGRDSRAGTSFPLRPAKTCPRGRVRLRLGPVVVALGRSGVSEAQGEVSRAGVQGVVAPGAHPPDLQRAGIVVMVPVHGASRAAAQWARLRPNDLPTAHRRVERLPRKPLPLVAHHVAHPRTVDGRYRSARAFTPLTCRAFVLARAAMFALEASHDPRQLQGAQGPGMHRGRRDTAVGGYVTRQMCRCVRPTAHVFTTPVRFLGVRCACGAGVVDRRGGRDPVETAGGGAARSVLDSAAPPVVTVTGRAVQCARSSQRVPAQWSPVRSLRSSCGRRRRPHGWGCRCSSGAVRRCR